MFWKPIFENLDNNLVLLKFLNLVAHIGGHKNIFGKWCDDIPAEYMKMQVEKLLRVLENEFSQLLPGLVLPQMLHIVHLNIKNICEFMSILYNSNQRLPRLLDEHFVMKNIGKYFEPIYIFKDYLSKKEESLIKYPFLFELDFKYDLLRIESIYQQKVNMQKNVSNGLKNLLEGQL